MRRSASNPMASENEVFEAQQRDVERYRRLAEATVEDQLSERSASNEEAKMDDHEVSQNHRESIEATDELRATASRNVEVLVEEARALLEAGSSAQEAFMELTAKVTLRSMVAGQDPASTKLMAALCESVVRLAQNPGPSSPG